MRWTVAAVILAGLASILVLRGPPAYAAVLPLPNGDFEAGATGWAPATGGTLTIDGSQPVNGGAAAGHVQSSAAGTVTVRSQYWLTAVTPPPPAKGYTLTLALRIPAATIASVSARIDLVNASGVVLVSGPAATRTGPTTGGGYVAATTASVTAPSNTAFVLVVVSGTATAAGARFSIDDIVVTEAVLPTPTPTPTPSPGSSPPPDPAPAPPADDAGPPPDEPEAPVVLRPSNATVVRAPSAASTPKPASAPLSTRLVNGTFDTSLTGWNIARGRAWTDVWIPGQGSSMVLYTPSTATVWAEQVIGGIRPGAWYQASALLSTRGSVNAGWLRIAWHPSDNGNGAAITTDDSYPVEASEAQAVAAAPRYQVVGTGAVQAPPIAGSATVRVLLRPEGAGGAWLIVDDVTFGAAEAPEPGGALPRSPRALPVSRPPAAAAAAPTILRGAFAGLVSAATPTPAAAPRAATPASTPRSSATPTSTPAGLRVENVVAPGTADAQRAIRITQLLPDPANPGRDSEYEWVELTNLGATPASVEGMTLRDNSGSVALPALVIPAGGMLVVTARLADVPGATAFRLAQSIGNGLGNAGDRLVLSDADGRQVDALSYGDDTTFLVGARIRAPGTGRAIERRFAADGSYRDAVILDQPAPGRARFPGPAASSPPPVTAPREGAAAAAAATAATGAPGTWLVLLSLGAGLLGGVGAQRIAAITRERRP